MGGHELTIAIVFAALPLWLLVRIGARIVNSLDAAQVPLREIALLHYRIAGVQQPHVLKQEMAEQGPPPGPIQAEQGSAFNPWADGEEEGQW